MQHTTPFPPSNELRKGEAIDPLELMEWWLTYCLLIHWWIHPVITSWESVKEYLNKYCTHATAEIILSWMCLEPARHFMLWMGGVCQLWTKKILSLGYVFAHTGCSPVISAVDISFAQLKPSVLCIKNEIITHNTCMLMKSSLLVDWMQPSYYIAHLKMHQNYKSDKIYVKIELQFIHQTSLAM